MNAAMAIDGDNLVITYKNTPQKKAEQGMCYDYNNCKGAVLANSFLPGGQGLPGASAFADGPYRANC